MKNKQQLVKIIFLTLIVVITVASIIIYMNKFSSKSKADEFVYFTDTETRNSASYVHASNGINKTIFIKVIAGGNNTLSAIKMNISGNSNVSVLSIGTPAPFTQVNESPYVAVLLNKTTVSSAEIQLVVKSTASGADTCSQLKLPGYEMVGPNFSRNSNADIILNIGFGTNTCAAATATPIATATPTDVPAAGNPTATTIPNATATQTPTPTLTPTATPTTSEPTATITPTPTVTATPTVTLTPTATNTPVPGAAVIGAPGIPTTTSLATDTTPTWTWGQSSTAGVSYEFEWCLNLDFSGCAGNKATLSAATYSNVSALANGRWYSRVRAVNSTDFSVWATTLTIHLIDISVPSISFSSYPNTSGSNPYKSTKRAHTPSATDYASKGAVVVFTITDTSYIKNLWQDWNNSNLGGVTALLPTSNTYSGNSETINGYLTFADKVPGDYVAYVKAEDNTGHISTVASSQTIRLMAPFTMSASGQITPNTTTGKFPVSFAFNSQGASITQIRTSINWDSSKILVESAADVTLQNNSVVENANYNQGWIVVVNNQSGAFNGSMINVNFKFKPGFNSGNIGFDSASTNITGINATYLLIPGMTCFTSVVGGCGGAVPTATQTPTPTLTPTATPIASGPTATITPTPTTGTIAGCACTSNRCTSSCVDSTGAHLWTSATNSFACYNDSNCSNTYGRSIGDATGDGKACLTDLEFFLKTSQLMVGFNTPEQESRVDFNGDGSIVGGSSANSDFAIWKTNYGSGTACMQTF